MATAAIPPEPNFFSHSWLLAHERWCADFYRGRNLDSRPNALGGFYHCYRDDGSIFDLNKRHVVSSTRFVLNYSWLWEAAPVDSKERDEYVRLMRHGITFLREVHRHPVHGGYFWSGEIVPSTVAGEKATLKNVDWKNQCYALDFAILAYAHGVRVGIRECSAWLEETLELLESKFWEEKHGLYADAASVDWSEVDQYRGINCNMHAVEALLTVYEVTGRAQCLARAASVAFKITVELAHEGGGLVWEHFDSAWRADFTYNKVGATPEAVIFRPYGFQPGHLGEWSKLLLQLHHHRAALPVQLSAKWRQVVEALKPNQRTADTLALTPTLQAHQLAEMIARAGGANAVGGCEQPPASGEDSVESMAVLRELTLAASPSLDIIASLQPTLQPSAGATPPTAAPYTEWMLVRACSLFTAAVCLGWDLSPSHVHGGLCYSFGDQADRFVQRDPHKYHWVQCETAAAAAMLAYACKEQSTAGAPPPVSSPTFGEVESALVPSQLRRYDFLVRRWYVSLWRYSWRHLVDHRCGSWYRIVSAESQKMTDEKSPTGKTDYHTIGACHAIRAYTKPDEGSDRTEA